MRYKENTNEVGESQTKVYFLPPPKNAIRFALSWTSTDGHKDFRQRDLRQRQHRIYESTQTTSDLV